MLLIYIVFSFINLVVGTLPNAFIAVLFTLLLFLSTNESYIFVKLDVILKIRNCGLLLKVED
jgi:hypothetical protein